MSSGDQHKRHDHSESYPNREPHQRSHHHQKIAVKGSGARRVAPGPSGAMSVRRLRRNERRPGGAPRQDPPPHSPRLTVSQGAPYHPATNR